VVATTTGVKVLRGDKWQVEGEKDIYVKE